MLVRCAIIIMITVWAMFAERTFSRQWVCLCSYCAVRWPGESCGCARYLIIFLNQTHHFYRISLHYSPMNMFPCSHTFLRRHRKLSIIMQMRESLEDFYFMDLFHVIVRNEKIDFNGWILSVLWLLPQASVEDWAGVLLHRVSSGNGRHSYSWKPLIYETYSYILQQKSFWWCI